MNERTDHILFNDLVPLPFRVIFVLQFGYFLWFLLVQVLVQAYHVNVLKLLQLSYSSHNYPLLGGDTTNSGEHHVISEPDFQENLTLSRGLWNNLKQISLVNGICFAVFKYCLINKDTNIVQRAIFHLVPFYALGNLLVVMFFIQSPQGQRRSFTTLKRIIKGSINSTTMRTNDILLSDTLTSYSKVLNDIGLYLWSYYYSSQIQYNVYLEFLILSAPTIIRISQCWQEYTLHRGTVRAHVLNMIKYLISLLPLVVNLLIKITILRQHDEQTEIHRLDRLNSWWYVVSFLSSSYSFLWDVFMDWKLAVFNGTQLGIRPTLLFGPKPIYVMAIWIDFIVRFLWIGKLFIDKEINETTSMVTKFTTFLFAYDAFSAGYTIVELTEIVRRWMWCFLKLENDYVSVQLQDGIELKNVK